MAGTAMHKYKSARLTPAERKAVLTEIMKQQLLFRQNCAMLHGLPDSGDLTVLEDVPAAETPVTPTPTPTPPVTVNVNPASPTQDVTGTGASQPWPLWKKALAVGATVAGLGGAATLPVMAWQLLQKTPAAAVVPAPVTNTLDELSKLGLDRPTDLGTDVMKAFKQNPALRDKLMRDVRSTLETPNAGPGPSNPSQPAPGTGSSAGPGTTVIPGVLSLPRQR